MSALYLIVAALCSTALADVVYYDSFTEAILSQDQVAEKEAAGTAYYCVNAIESCSPTEGRRLDGTCSNLEHPYAGAATYAFKNLVPITSAPSRGRIPPSREVRTALLHSGYRTAPLATQLGLLFINLFNSDYTPMTVRDCNNYIMHKTCCIADADPMCVRMDVPKWDYMARLTGIECLNLTRPIDFQSEGCIAANVTPPHRINHGSASLDMKWMYAVDELSSIGMRRFEGGLLNFTVGPDGKDRPSFTSNPANIDDGMSGTGAFNYFFAILFWNEHNRIARELAVINPSWSDQQLFDKARDINIAQTTQIFLYEALPIFFNYDNMVEDGLLASAPGFRDVYDASVLPGFWTESLFALRWFHAIQRLDVQRYTLTGSEYDRFPQNILDMPMHFNAGENLTYFAQGLFRTHSGKDDDSIDAFIGESLYIPRHRAGDLGTTDVEKGRLLNVAPYVDYVKECTGVYHTSYETLGDHLNEDTIDVLKQLYDTDEPAAVELMPALWREKHYPGTKVPKTLYCLFVKQLRRIVQSDRHWYERPNRPQAFNAAQLAQIRKSSMARLFCNNMPGVPVTGITAKPFLPLSETNPIVSCDVIPHVELSAWLDAQNTSEDLGKVERKGKEPKRDRYRPSQEHHH